MTVQQHEQRAPGHIRFAVITVSDSRNEKTDTGGALAKELIQAKGYSVMGYEVVPDDVKQIQKAVRGFVKDQSVHAVVLTGGTGITTRDVTVDAVEGMGQIRLEGFGELFRHLSFHEIGAATILSRATAVIVDRKPVFSLPGSPKAVRLGLEKIILSQIGHILAELKR